MSEGDAELIALHQVIEALQLLSVAEQARIIAYVIARFGIDLEDL